MRQAYLPLNESYDEDTDTPLEGKKSCMAEAYKEGIYECFQAKGGISDKKLLN